MNARRPRILLSFLLILICESSLLAQNHYNFRQFTSETGEFLTQPLRWRGTDWLRLGLIATGTALVMEADQPVRDAVLKGNRKYYYSVPIEVGRIWGEWYTPPVVAGGFALHAWLAHSTSSKKICFELVEAVIASESVTGALKFAIGRSRPYLNEGAFSFHPFSFRNFGFQSLPGGHNTEGWAMSTVLSRNAHPTALKILAYAPATLTFVSRIYQDKHWTSDCFLGAIIGYMVGNWVMDLHEKKESAVSVTSINPLTVSISF